MTILRRAIWMAAKRAASDPRVQAKAAEVVRDDIAPRVRAAVNAARPEIQKAKENVQRAGKDMKKSVAAHPSIREAKDFLDGIGRGRK